MRALTILIAVLLTVTTPVVAQVTVDLHALDALPDRPATARPARVVPPSTPRTPAVVTREAAPVDPTPAPTAQRAPQPAASQPTASQPAASQAAQRPAASQAAQQQTAPQPALPQAAPLTASINPIAPPEPPAGSAPPPPPPVSDTATTKAAPTAAGLRLTFAADQSDLNQDSSASIKQLAASVPSNDDTTFTVQAYAPGKPDDPSTARRVSLSRAMAVRSALVADGVPSARIFVRALGDQYGDGPPDRVDIAVSAPSGAAAAR